MDVAAERFDNLRDGFGVLGCGRLEGEPVNDMAHAAERGILETGSGLNVDANA